MALENDEKLKNSRNEGGLKKKGNNNKKGKSAEKEIPNGINAAEINGNTVEAKENDSDKQQNEQKLPSEDTKEIQKDNANSEEKSAESTLTESLEMYQDCGITVHIQSPGSEMLSIQVSSMELVQEIHQLLMDREDTCHRTCFSLQLDGVVLDNFAELKNVDGLIDGSVIKVVEEPYTCREARIHVRHVRDLLKSMDPTDAYNGVDCNSLTFLSVFTQGDILEKKKTAGGAGRAEQNESIPPEFILPGSKERPLLPLHPGVKLPKAQQALKVLTTSAWNPPPGPRKLHGDLMYLYVITAEDKRFHISACPKGFYINQSTDEIFNPKPDNPSHLCHSLIDLLSQISPTFKRVFSQMQRKRTQRHAFERVATPYQVYSWASPPLDHSLDAIRAEDAFSSKLGYEEHIPGQTRDWNEELQTTRELPRKTLPDRLLRERAIFKVHGDFVIAATRGAMAVIDGNVLAINPGEDAKMQMFIWNNIFFSLGFDVRDHYKELGGDVAAFVAPRNDLHGVRVYSAVDIEGLYTLGTVVIDYRGYRVTAQSIIPGILEREQEQSVIYGSIDFGKTVLSHPKYLELLTLAGQHLKILPHSVLNEKGEEIELCSSVECKGIIGNDGRHYILDLLRTFPPDVNFLKLTDEELSDEMKKMGFPIEHKHKLCCLRQELLEAFVEDRYVQFIKNAAHHLQQINATAAAKKKNESEDADTDTPSNLKAIENNNEVEEKIAEKSEDDIVAKPETETVKKEDEQEVKKITDSISEKTNALPGATDAKQAADVVKRACAAVGSLREYEFDFRFNPDVFSSGIKHVDKIDSPCSLKKQKQLVKDAAEFLLTKQIPTFVHEHSDHSSAPMDSTTFTDAMHSRGINMRYLGKVIQILAKFPKLEYLYQIAAQELVIRATKHIYYSYMQNTEMMSLAQAISHFLNCFLTSGPVQSPTLGSDELYRTNKRRNKRKIGSGKNSALFGSDNNEWATITQKSLWQHIKKECKAYWDFELGCDNIEQICEQYKLQRISILRAFCLKVGIQIALREYNFDPRNKSTFNDDDIINVFPIVKHINPRASDAYNFYTTGQTKIQQGYFKEGYELISEALNLLNNVFGAMHPENAQCLRMLARLSYIMGDPQEALAIQQRAVIMSERVNGIDHPYTALEYAHLALYTFANGHTTTALKLLYRARYLVLLIFGENHPDIALLDSNIALILHATSEYELSLKYLENALALNIKYFGKKSLKVAVSYHLVARTQGCMGDFRSALNNEKETYAIYKQQLGETHEKTQESSECLKLLTQQAVFLQKKMNDIYTNGKLTTTTGLPPIHIQPPTIASVLDMLNAINGILFVQISPKDIQKLRSEIEKQQKENVSTNGATEKITEENQENQESLKRIFSAAMGGNNNSEKTDDKLINGNNSTTDKIDPLKEKQNSNNIVVNS